MLKDFFQKTTDVISKNSPAILTGIGAVGLVTTVILAVKATPKAICLIQDRVWEKYKEEVPNKDIEYHEWLDVEPKTYQYKAEMKKLGWKEVIKVAWKPYIPAAAVGIVTMFSSRICHRTKIL